jgi:hypothetical protein
LYDPPVLLLVGLAAVFVLAWPNDALAGVP